MVKKGSIREINATHSSAHEFETHINARDDLALKAQLLDISGEAIFAWELNGGIEYWNNGGTTLYGYSPTDALGCVSHELLKTVFPESLDAIKEALQCNGKWRGELIHKHKDGNSIAVESIMKLVYVGDRRLVLETNRDITERKRAEESLVSAHRLIQSVIDNTSPIIYAFDLSHRFVLANMSLAKLFNTTPENMLGKRRHVFMPKEDADWHEGNDCKVIEAAKILKFEEYSNLNDRSITWLTTKFPLYDAAGKIYAVAGISADISEHKRLEEDLKRINATLEQRVLERTEDLQKLNEALVKSNRELESFAYVTSHDLQEPLRMVTSFTQLLEQKYGDQLDQNAKEYIGYAVGGAKRMYELINDLLSYSRITRKELAFSEVDLNEALEMVFSNLKLLIREKNCSIQSDELPVVFADRSQMIQLFQNLVGNGIKFSEKNPQIKISAKKDGTDLLFSVKDNGIGIEPQYSERIFEIFKRLHPGKKYEGTGIGLAICKRIVEHHGGKIWVESEPRKGSVFYFTIPNRQSY